MQNEDMLTFIQKEIEEALGTACSVELERKRWEGGTEAFGFIIQSENSSLRVEIGTPQLASDLDEREARKLAECILEIYVNSERGGGDKWDIDRFSAMRERIVFRLAPSGKWDSNQAPDPIVRTKFMEWDLVGAICLEKNDGEVWTMLVRNSHLKCWGISEQHLWELAGMNTPNLFPAFIRHIGEPGNAATGKGEVKRTEEQGEKERLEEELPLYILTTEYGVYGATGLLYKDLLYDFCERKGFSSILILPLNVDYVLILPEEKQTYADYLKGAAEGTLIPEMRRENRLSVNVYRYEPGSKRLTVC